MRLRLTNQMLIVLGLLFGSAVNSVFSLEKNMDSATLLKDLTQLRKTKAASYQVRTEHYKADGSPQYINRLIREDSPYLLQHAHNPVNWYAWGDEAFAAAKKANKPIFLSIGYSTCHWCHVMEVESFDNKAVAELLNRWFISIKIDREQRPDLDEIYMTAVQLTTGSGGWPMSNFLTPDGKPFFGGTYFPAEAFKNLLTRVNSVWLEQETLARRQAEAITQQVNQYLSSSELAAYLDNKLLSYWKQQILSRYDPINGGFNQAPKFPNETELLFLQDQLKRSEPVNLKLQQMISYTLDRMAQGGLYDQIAGGFHRYSTDNEWLLPHFEKMLYNQALLGQVYAQSYFFTANHFHQQIARETFDYVLRDMKSPSGGFYSATDADSEGEEGTFFLWQAQQLKTLLNEKDYQFLKSLYGISETGNFAGKNILHLVDIPSVYQSGLGKLSQLNKWQTRLKKIKHQLYLAREKRIHPFKDKKIITAWNGMMITALAKAATLLNEPRYLIAAQQAADYLWQYHYDQKLGLFRISLEGDKSIAATQEDYAYYAEGLINLYDNGGGKIYLQQAQRLLDKMMMDFMDTHGGFYLSNHQTKGPLISKIKSSHDGAIPSGNSVALSALVSMANKTENLANQQALSKTLAYFSGKIKQQGTAHSYAMLAVSKSLNGEIAPKITLANGHVRANINWLDLKTKRFALTLTIDKGWHINGNKTLSQNLIPTRLSLATKESQANLSIDYPPARTVPVSFSKQALLLFTDVTVIRGQLLGNITEAPKLKLVLQACNDVSCLAPEERILILRAIGKK